jgi:hypothetical protein
LLKKISKTTHTHSSNISKNRWFFYWERICVKPKNILVSYIELSEFYDS